MPKLLSESLSVETGKTGKLWRARILEANVQGSSAYYPAEVLERDGSRAFPADTPVYMNHPTADEKWNQPERDAEKIIGYLATEAVFEADGLYANIHIYSDKREWLLCKKWLLAQLKYLEKKNNIILLTMLFLI